MTNPAGWKTAVEPFADKVVTDSARYEWSQLPGMDGTKPPTGFMSSIAFNSTDQTASFALIRRVYTQPSSRSFNEAKGLVMNDYQTLLEEEWISKLKKKYPVVIDQKVLATILK